MTNKFIHVVVVYDLDGVETKKYLIDANGSDESQVIVKAEEFFKQDINEDMKSMECPEFHTVYFNKSGDVYEVLCHGQLMYTADITVEPVRVI